MMNDMHIELAERRLPIPDMPPAQEGTGSPATMDDAYDVRAAGAAGTPRGKELENQSHDAPEASDAGSQSEEQEHAPAEAVDPPVDVQVDGPEPARTVTAMIALHETVEVADDPSAKDPGTEPDASKVPEEQEPEEDEANQTVVDEPAKPPLAEGGDHNDGDDGGDDDEHEERRPEPREPITGIIAEVVAAERLPRYSNSLEVPGLRARLNDLAPGEFILVGERTPDSPVGETARFEDDETLKAGLDLEDDQEARVGVFSTPFDETAVLLKPFAEEHPYEDDMTGVDSVILEDGMAKAINDNSELRHRHIRAVEAVGYAKYASGAIDSGTGEPLSNVALMTRFEENATTFQHHLWGGEQAPTQEQIKEVVGRAGYTIGAMHAAGLIHGSPHAGNFLRVSDTSDTVVTDFEGSATFNEARDSLPGIRIQLQDDLETFAGEIVEWHHQGRIAEEQARQLLGHFSDRYRTAAYGRDTKVPWSARLSADEIMDIDL